MIPPAQDYASSRASFLDLVRVAGSVVESHLHPEQGPAGEELACDVARFGAPPGDAATVVLISSGLHGVEGHAGWGLQRLLVESGRLATLAPSVAVVLVHAVNPFGFAWSRRVDHDNIDVNRNFVDVDHLPANPRYAEVDRALNPTSDQFDPDDLSFLAELQELVDLAGMLEAFRVISGGQYSHPQGVQFGGQHESWSRRTLERIWADHLPGAVRAVALDIHTGLGPTGRLTVFQTANEDEPAAELGRSWFPDYLYRADRDEEQATDTGLMGPGFDSWVAASEDLVADTAAFVIEFGTHDPIQGVTVFRADNWLHHHGDPRSDLGVEIRRRMRDFFFVEDEEWRRVVAEQGMAAITAALDGVGA